METKNGQSYKQKRRGKYKRWNRGGKIPNLKPNSEPKPTRLARLAESVKSGLSKVWATVKSLPASVWSWIKAANIKNLFKKFFSLALLVLSFALASVAVMSGKQVHMEYLSWLSTGKIFKACTNEFCNGGTGTAFLVVAQSGNSYVLTNSHVCKMGKGKLYFNYIDGNGKSVTFSGRILEDSDETDLCLLENNSGNSGFYLDFSDVTRSSMLTVMGHPLGNPLTITQGFAVSREKVIIDIGVIFEESMPDDLKNFLGENLSPYLMDESQCQAKKNEIRVVNIAPHLSNGLAKICSLTFMSIKSTVDVRPGNSGSPVLSHWGTVSGIIFALNAHEKWSYFIEAKEIRKMLSKY